FLKHKFFVICWSECRKEGNDLACTSLGQF
ncbi:unnamed protein product, partial [Coffea canephora]